MMAGVVFHNNRMRHHTSVLMCATAVLTLIACDGAPGGAAAGSDQTRTITALPDPCEWLAAAEAQRLLGLEQLPQQTPMGNPDSAGRSCVYTDADQSAWINVSYQGLNPQVFSFRDKTDDEMRELAGNLYAHGMTHVESSDTRGLPTLAFGDAERTILIVITDIGKARDLPEDFPAGYGISSYINPVLHLFGPHQSPDDRLAALKRLAERPVAQLTEVAAR